MNHFLEKLSFKGTRFEQLNTEIDFLGKAGKPLPLTIIAGVNGSGKSQLLKLVAQQFDQGLQYGSLFLDYFASRGGVIDTNVFKKYIDKVIYEKGLSKNDALDDINKKIFGLIPDFKLRIDSLCVKDHFKVIFKNEFGATFDSGLASGEITLLNSIFKLYLEEVNNQLILIDEPEISLHPAWQSQVVQLYENYAKQNNCQIILATHSPFVLSAVKSEQIRLLKRTPKGIKIEKIEEEINGWTIERILKYFMDTEHIRDPKTDIEIAKLFDIMKNGNINKGSFKKRFTALENRLTYADKDVVSLKMELNRLQQNARN